MRKGIPLGSLVNCAWCSAPAIKRGSKRLTFCENDDKCRWDAHASKRGSISTLQQIHLLILQDLQCAGCYRLVQIDLCQTDHVIPRAKGGSDDLLNIQLLCASCNKSKGANSMEHFMDKGLRWVDGPCLSYRQAREALVFYCKWKRIEQRCQGILKSTVSVHKGDKESAAAVLDWIELNEV